MKVLSWDVGIVNMAYCLLEINENNVGKIIEWDTLNLIPKSKCCDCKKGATYYVGNIYTCETHKVKGCKKIPTATQIDIVELTLKLIEKLDSKKHLLECDTVLIENQPSLKNPKMKSVSSCLFNYFLIRGVVDNKTIKEVKYISATNKLKNAKVTIKKEECKTKYIYNKKAGKEYCEQLIGGNVAYKELYSSHTKKDDLADCLLQGLYYLDKNFKNFNLE